MHAGFVCCETHPRSSPGSSGSSCISIYGSSLGGRRSWYGASTARSKLLRHVQLYWAQAHRLPVSTDVGTRQWNQKQNRLIWQRLSKSFRVNSRSNQVTKKNAPAVEVYRNISRHTARHPGHQANRRQPCSQRSPLIREVRKASATSFREIAQALNARGMPRPMACHIYQECPGELKDASWDRPDRGRRRSDSIQRVVSSSKRLIDAVLPLPGIPDDRVMSRPCKAWPKTDR